jgi:hypothetical protein
MNSLQVWLTLAGWFALSIVAGPAIGKVLHKLNPTGDDDANRRAAWGDLSPAVRDEVANLEAWNVSAPECPELSPIRRATR